MEAIGGVREVRARRGEGKKKTGDATAHLLNDLPASLSRVAGDGTENRPNSDDFPFFGTSKAGPERGEKEGWDEENSPKVLESPFRVVSILFFVADGSSPADGNHVSQEVREPMRVLVGSDLDMIDREGGG